MSRKRRRSHTFSQQNNASTPDTQAQQSAQAPHKRIVGMISVKTIRSPDGSVIIRQGEKIREEVVSQHEDVISEIMANAMPVKK